MKRMMLVAGLALLAAARGWAQAEVGQWMVTPRVGLNLANRSEVDLYVTDGTDQKVEHKIKRGLHVGVETEYQLYSGLGLSAGLVYSQQGTRYEDIDQFWRDQRLTMHYLNVPLLAHCYVGQGLAFEVGLQPGFLLGCRLEGEEYFSEGNRSGYRSFKESNLGYRTFDIGLPVGLSYDMGPVRLECRYCFGLHDTTKFGLKERNNVLQFAVGYCFGL